jgi:phosphoglycolate phosphatase
MLSLSPIAVFDLDGTLADTAPDLMATLNRIMAEEGLAAVPLSDAREMIGAGARAMISKGYERAGLELAPDKLDRLFTRFLAIYADHLCDHSVLFPHVVEALDVLEARGFILAVCTNKIESHSRQLLTALGIAGRFKAICGRDTFAFFKPDPRHLPLTIEAAGGDPACAVMVGDSRTDIATAKAAGMPVVAVTFGYTDVPVEALDPDVVIDSFAKLVGAFDTIAGRRATA